MVQYHKRVGELSTRIVRVGERQRTAVSFNSVHQPTFEPSLFVHTRDGALVLGVTLCCTLHSPRERRRALKATDGRPDKRQALRFSASALPLRYGVEGTVRKGTYNSSRATSSAPLRLFLPLLPPDSVCARQPAPNPTEGKYLSTCTLMHDTHSTMEKSMEALVLAMFPATLVNSGQICISMTLLRQER